MRLSPPSRAQPLRAAIALAGLCALAACAAPGDQRSGATEGARGKAPAERYDVEAIRTVQRRLNVLGYAAGPVDGAYGPATRSGIQAFQREHGMTPTGRPTQRLLAALKDAALPRPPAEKPRQQAPSEPADDRHADTGTGRSQRAGAADRDAPVSLPVPEKAAATHGETARKAAQRTDSGDSRATAALQDAPDERAKASAEADGNAEQAGGRDAAGTAAGQPPAEDVAPGNNAAARQSERGQADTAGGNGRETGGTTAPTLSEIELAGTRWRLAGGPNRAIQITLEPGGNVEAPVGDWSWRREGRKIYLTFDSGARSRSERTGKLVSRDRIEGTGKDTFGRSWSWHASRVSKAAANR